jgi:transcription initiation factor TFIIIB Brf1 subunit/transcription initiation factor TFIIB
VKVGRYTVLKALAIWLSCRKLGLPVLIGEVATSHSLPTSALYHAYREANIMAQMIAEPLRIPSLVDRVVKVCGLDPKLIDLTEQTLRNIRIEGCNPNSVAAAALALTCQRLGHRIRQRPVCDALMISEVTLRNVMKRIKAMSGRTA